MNHTESIILNIFFTTWQHGRIFPTPYRNRNNKHCRSHLKNNNKQKKIDFKNHNFY